MLDLLRYTRDLRARPKSSSALAVSDSGSAINPLVKRATLLDDGGNQDWSRTNGLVAYDKKDSEGNRQLYLLDPDGGVGPRVITRPGRHVVCPAWHYSGQWLIAQVENDWHPFVWWRKTDWVTELVINGMGCELYAAAVNGGLWYRLTDSVWPAASGHMSVHCSYNSNMVTWAKLVSSDGVQAPWGRYRLMVGILDVIGRIPKLVDVRDCTPKGAVFIEPHGFSLDNEWVLYSGYHHSGNKDNFDIGEINLNTGEDRRITNHPYWDEHGSYAPDERSVAYMAGELGVAPFTGDLMLTSRLGATKSRLTAFNHIGHQGYTEGKVMVMRPSWSADGKRLTATEMPSKGFPGRRRLWMLEL